MEIASPIKASVLGLIRALTGDTKTFIRQEIQLAKTELSEKISKLGKNAVSLAIGGFVAYAGLIVLLLGLGCLIAWLLEKADLAPLLATFVGLGGMGLLVVVVGCVLLFKGVRAISAESLSPQRTIQTLQDLKGGADEYSQESEEQPKPNSEEMQARVEDTENRMGDTLDELGRRLSPSHINAEVKKKIRAKPYHSGLIAMAAGLVSGLIIRRKLRHAA